MSCHRDHTGASPRATRIGLAIAAVLCAVTSSSAQKPSAAIPSGPPIETRDIVGPGQVPAFPEQTRAPSVETKTPIKVEVVAHGLNHPWALVFMPNRKILLTEKPGTLRVITTDGKVGSPIEGVPEVFVGADAGLLDVVLDPAFAKNRMIYLSYVEKREVGNGVAVAKAHLSTDESKLDGPTTILHVQPAVDNVNHYGSRLLFDKHGYLFVTLGERFSDPTRAAAESLASHMGKILRITTDGAAAPGNPFEHTAGALPEIWSYGNRNPQGLFFNPITGDLWETEHGPLGGDELNLIKPGLNYGWPIIAYGLNYDKTPVGSGKQVMEGMQQPLYYWNPSVAASASTFYTASLIPEWKNNLFVTTLAGQHVSRLVLKGNRVIGEEALLVDQKQRMRAIQQGPDGALWVITDNEDGRLIRLAPASK
jgi:glucose/arabinose dehydrogenase